MSAAEHTIYCKIKGMEGRQIEPKRKRKLGEVQPQQIKVQRIDPAKLTGRLLL